MPNSTKQPAVLTCAYCGKIKKEISFVIGSFKPREWTMHFGTGKLSCDNPECYRKGCNEAQSQLAAHIRSLTPVTEVRKPDDRMIIDTTHDEPREQCPSLRQLS